MNKKMAKWMNEYFQESFYLCCKILMFKIREVTIQDKISKFDNDRDVFR